MKRFVRFGFYLLGMGILCFGLTLNSLTGWGIAPMISVAWVLAQLFGVTFGMAATCIYLLLVGAQLVMRGRSATVMELLQLPVSFGMGLFLDLFEQFVALPGDGLLVKATALALGIICTAAGACTVLNMRLAPSPADGFIQTMADATGKGRGFCKNVIDVSFASVTIALGLIFAGELVGIGIGTVISVFAMGRTMAVFDRITQKNMCALAGVSAETRAVRR